MKNLFIILAALVIIGCDNSMNPSSGVLIKPKLISNFRAIGTVDSVKIIYTVNSENAYTSCTIYDSAGNNRMGFSSGTGLGSSKVGLDSAIIKTPIYQHGYMYQWRFEAILSHSQDLFPVGQPPNIIKLDSITSAIDTSMVEKSGYFRMN